MCKLAVCATADDHCAAGHHSSLFKRSTRPASRRGIWWATNRALVPKITEVNASILPPAR
jgi:hypothetical protein